MTDLDELTEDPCQTCHGDKFEECETSNTVEGCWEAECDGYFHLCPNCLGSGRAKDQGFW